jgi:hypothetical protein
MVVTDKVAAAAANCEPRPPGETIMHDDTTAPATAPAPSSETTAPSAPPRETTGRAGRWRAVVLLGIGAGVGLAVGVVATMWVSSTVTLFSPTLPVPATKDSLEVFNQLNEMRQQINQLNEEKKRQEQEKEQEQAEAVRKALSAVASTVRESESKAAPAAPPAKKEGAAPEARPVEKRHDGFEEVDEEMERLERTQKVLNGILDLFTRKGKEPPREPRKDTTRAKE